MNFGHYELHPHNTNQASFYGKANVNVYIDGTNIRHILTSYDTDVLTVYVSAGTATHIERIWPGYSDTTLRHINELLMQQGFPKLSARAFRAMEIGKLYSADDVPELENSLK